jgi:hypothetical protein
LKSPKYLLTFLDPVEESLPNGMAVLSTPLRQDGYFISREISMVKLCESGCGNLTLPAKWTNRRTGLIKPVESIVWSSREESNL